jgi:thioester reductase-like protein
MNYFVTGATGFIGKRLIAKLLARPTRSSISWYAASKQTGSRNLFHLVSSIAAAGLYEGVFREDMFDEAENLENPYFMTKHESEKIVRKECKMPVARLPPGDRGRRLARPARWTRSTAPTTSSS